MFNEIDKYVGAIGKWWIRNDCESVFTAQIIIREGNYILLGQHVSKIVMKKIQNYFEKSRPNINEPSDIYIYGKVGSQKVSLVGCLMGKNASSFCSILGDMEYCVEIIPCELLIGDFYVDNQTVISKASVLYKKMDEFINMRAYKSDVGPSLLKRTDVEPVSVNNVNFTMNITPALMRHSSHNKEIFENMIFTNIRFNSALSIDRMRSVIIKLKLLFSLLKLNLIDIDGVDLHVEPSCSSESECRLNLSYHMNYMERDIDELWHVPVFALKYVDISDFFERVVSSWFDLFEKAEPVIELFYQCLIRKSHDINRFLNISQALEVYSNKYRSNDVKEVYCKFPNDNPNDSSPKLFHKIYDIFSMFKDCFGYDENQRITISHWITDTRNYYTHYGTKAKRKALANFNERSPVTDLMFYLLTFAVYCKLGIPIDVIKCKFYHPLFKGTLDRVSAIYNATLSDSNEESV